VIAAALFGIAGDLATELLGGIIPDGWTARNKPLILGAFIVTGAGAVVVAFLLWRSERTSASSSSRPSPPPGKQSSKGPIASIGGQLGIPVGINNGSITVSNAPTDQLPRSERNGSGGTITGAVPLIPRVFLGRTSLLDELHRELHGKAASTTVVAAYGLGGVGKTALAVAYVSQYRADYSVVGWISAESPPMIAAGLANLAPSLGVEVSHDQDAIVTEVLAELSRRSGWLLIFDNAEDPRQFVRPPFGDGRGHILVTSRNPAWDSLATTIEVDTLDEEAAAQLLLARTGAKDEVAAGELARILGCLPLALTQAAAYIAETPGCDLSGYLERYRQASAPLLAESSPLDYPAPVAVTWQLNISALRKSDPLAEKLLKLCAFLAPSVIPLDLFRGDPQFLPRQLRSASSDRLRLDGLLRSLYRYSLVGRHQDGIRVHQLVQAVTRDRLNRHQRRTWAKIALKRVSYVFRSIADDPQHWWLAATLVAHALMVAELIPSGRRKQLAAARLLTEAGSFLRRQGKLAEARKTLEQALTILERCYGPTHPEVAGVLNGLGDVVRDLRDLPASWRLLTRALQILEQT
jgi:hypothetical protein